MDISRQKENAEAHRERNEFFGTYNAVFDLPTAAHFSIFYTVLHTCTSIVRWIGIPYSHGFTQDYVKEINIPFHFTKHNAQLTHTHEYGFKKNTKKKLHIEIERKVYIPIHNSWWQRESDLKKRKIKSEKEWK